MSRYTIECGHAVCNCEVTAPAAGGEDYCSDYCRDAQLTEDQDVCGCGHPPCDEP